MGEAFLPAKLSLPCLFASDVQAGNGECNDSGVGGDGVCAIGSDCTDCGSRGAYNLVGWSARWWDMHCAHPCGASAPTFMLSRVTLRVQLSTPRQTARTPAHARDRAAEMYCDAVVVPCTESDDCEDEALHCGENFSCEPRARECSAALAFPLPTEAATTTIPPTTTPELTTTPQATTTVPPTTTTTTPAPAAPVSIDRLVAWPPAPAPVESNLGFQQPAGNLGMTQPSTGLGLAQGFEPQTFTLTALADDDDVKFVPVAGDTFDNAVDAAGDRAVPCDVSHNRSAHNSECGAIEGTQWRGSERRGRVCANAGVGSGSSSGTLRGGSAC